MATAQLNGISLYYEEHGEGAPLVLVAGLSSDSQSWLPVIEPLAAHYRLILPDNRMVGRTEPKTVETGIEIMADDVVALMDALGVTSVDCRQDGSTADVSTRAAYIMNTTILGRVSIFFIGGSLLKNCRRPAWSSPRPTPAPGRR